MSEGSMAYAPQGAQEVDEKFACFVKPTLISSFFIELGEANATLFLDDIINKSQ
jgi:hypothetical protein